MHKMKTNKEQQIQYDKEDYNNLIVFEHQKEVLLDSTSLLKLPNVVTIKELDTIPYDVKVNLSYLIDTEDELDIYIYFYVINVLHMAELLDKAEMYSKDFYRDLESLKEKVDFIARLSVDVVVVELPIPLSIIKQNFYKNCKAHNIHEKLISSLFDIVFECKKYRGKFANVDMSSLDSPKEANKFFISCLDSPEEIDEMKRSWRYDEIFKEITENNGDINQEKLDKHQKEIEKIITSGLYKDKYYIGNPHKK